MEQQIFQFGNDSIKLNEQQHQIVYSNLDINQKVIACAGSGKTTTIICRIKYLIENGVKPEKIWMTAFNIDAAQQIKTKLSQLIGKKGELVKINNIDKISKGLLCKLDYSMQEKIRKQDKELAEYKNNSHDSSITSSEFQKRGYLKIKDYTIELVKYLKLNPNQIQQNFEYFFFDEFQDINPDEYDFITLLGNNNVKISVIGDDAQNIYSFRDSEMSLLQTKINKDIESLQTFMLTTNYRSTPEIIQIANQTVKKSDELIKKEMIAIKPSIDKKPIIKQYKSVESQCQGIIQQLLIFIYVQNINPSKIAILCRHNSPLQCMEQAFIHNNQNDPKQAMNYKCSFQNENNNKNNQQKENQPNQANEQQQQKQKKDKLQKGQKQLNQFFNAKNASTSISTNPHINESVVLSSVHKSKGLEWDIVFLINCNDEFFPGSMANTEEDRRVFYVAVTRAKKQLYISYLKNENVFKMSRFLFQIEDKYFSDDSDYQSISQIQQLDKQIQKKQGQQSKQAHYLYDEIDQNQNQSDNNEFEENQILEIKKIKKFYDIKEVFANFTQDNYDFLQQQIFDKINLNLNKINQTVKVEAIHLPAQLGNWVQQNGLQEEFGNFFKKFITRSCLKQLFMYSFIQESQFLDQSTNKTLFISEENESYEYVKNKSQHSQLVKSLRIYQEPDRDPLKIFSHIFNVFACCEAYNHNKRQLLDRGDVLQNFELSQIFFKNGQQKFTEKYFTNIIKKEKEKQAYIEKVGQIFINYSQNKINKSSQNKEQIQFKTEIIPLTVGQHMFDFDFSQQGGLGKQNAMQYIQQAVLFNQTVEPKEKIQNIHIYNPLKGNVYQINIESLVKNEELCQNFTQIIVMYQEQLIQQQYKNVKYNFQNIKIFQNQNFDYDKMLQKMKNYTQEKQQIILQEQEKNFQGFQSANKLFKQQMQNEKVQDIQTKIKKFQPPKKISNQNLETKSKNINDNNGFQMANTIVINEDKQFQQNQNKKKSPNQFQPASNVINLNQNQNKQYKQPQQNTGFQTANNYQEKIQQQQKKDNSIKSNFQLQKKKQTEQFLDQKYKKQPQINISQKKTQKTQLQLFKFLEKK